MAGVAAKPEREGRMISRLRCIDPDEEPDERALARKRASRTMRLRTENYAMMWQLLKAFMGRADVGLQGERGVEFRFKTSLEAEQYHKFMMSAKGK
jgi:hypothetical protein